MTDFRVWAPGADRVDLVLATGELPMERADGGWWSLDVQAAGHGDRYSFRVDGKDPRPDPRSISLPDGPHKSTAVYDHHLFSWSDGEWAGRDLLGGVVYELHVGTFTPRGRLDTATEHLDHLVDLGVTHVALMPVVTWDGPRGWGYDGVAPWSVHEAYGGPDALKQLVDAAHSRGLAVLLDVVYNHLGPSGNYLADFGPYFHDAYHTPWGPAVNLDGAGSDEVRAYVVGNALSWLRDFHLDGLRLDAVHALHDERAEHLLEELARRVDDLSAELGRTLLLVAESDRNDPGVVTPRPAGGHGLDAQWTDDIHHALHTLLTGETQGYYADFAADPWEALGRTFTGAYFHAGHWSSFRGRSHGRPVDVDAIPGWRFLGYLQTHDQVGNRATGDRISAGLSPGLVACGAALVLTSPFTPMLFMGEEWGAATPWQFFTSYPDPVLGAAVSSGRREEFGEHGWSATEVPDPQDPATFERSRLDWDEPARDPHARLLRWHRDLIALRAAEPDLRDPWLTRMRVRTQPDERWAVVHRGRFRVVVNLSGTPRRVPLEPGPGAGPAQVVLGWDPAVRVTGGLAELPPESAAVFRAG